MKRTDEVDRILKEFPFYRKNRERQVRVLSQYLFVEPGENQEGTAEELGVDRETVRNIAEAWSQLDPRQKVVLNDFLRDQFVRQHSDLDQDRFLPDQDLP
ncbi:hypothetical protein ACM16X_02530 [Haloarcula japonica]|uniref:hypothetical protein n=1 Tax=Haloarcula japonica TaxID=29282 RepID=UPI0039F6F9B1